jgi:hypothetical protein
MDRNKPATDDRAEQESSAEANTLLLGGVGIAAIGIAGAIVGAAVCPVCVVAAPALLGLGAMRKIQAARRRASSKTDRRSRGGSTPTT